MKSDYEIIKYRPEHKPLVAELSKALWSTDVDLNKRYLEWKYESNVSLEPLIYLAFHQGSPVGMRGFHEARLEVGNPSRVVRVLVAGDALVASPHRDRSLVTRIMRMAYSDLHDRGYPYLVSVGGANRINAFGLLTLGWKSAGMLKPMGRIKRRVGLTKSLSGVIGRLPVLWRFRDTLPVFSADQRDPFRHLDKGHPARAAGEGLPITLASEPRLEFIVSLIDGLGHDGRIRYVRDHQYLAWRFANPMSEYRFLYWEEKSRTGYLVLSRRASDLGGWERVYVADLEASDLYVREQLISAAIRWGRFSELVTWTASLGEDELQILKDQDFVAVDIRDAARGCPCVMVRSFGEQLGRPEWLLGDRRILDPRNWDTRVLVSMRA